MINCFQSPCTILYETKLQYLFRNIFPRQPVTYIYAIFTMDRLYNTKTYDNQGRNYDRSHVCCTVCLRDDCGKTFVGVFSKVQKGF